MKISPAIKKQIESDISNCEAHEDIVGSEMLYSEIVARYTLLDPSFSKGLPSKGKCAGLGSEFDYRPELHAIVAKLKMYLLIGETEEDSDGNSRRHKNMGIVGRKTIEQILAEDIERCDQFLNHQPFEEKMGQQLYEELTGRYDSVIDGLGNGLYMYFAEQHFYDPEVCGESLKHNLRKILNKMLMYQATHYPPKEKSHKKVTNQSISNKVFVVHGHDNEAIQEMARTLEKGGFDSIILHEQPDSGMTIIEKIAKYSDVGYAVVLYTACDRGREKNDLEEKNRARQNVVFEHGYLIGKLGRDRVSALVKGDIETPGDINGVVYIEMDKKGAWKMQLAKNMKDVGLPVDMNTFCI